jgi:hypothetical protein
MELSQLIGAKISKHRFGLHRGNSVEISRRFFRTGNMGVRILQCQPKLAGFVEPDEGDRIKLRVAAVHESVAVQVFGCRDAVLSTR